jgi:hypothetical protein
MKVWIPLLLLIFIFELVFLPPAFYFFIPLEANAQEPIPTTIEVLISCGDGYAEDP